MTLRLYNTLTRRKEEFQPLDPGNLRVYVCGPTVYDYPHIGNARPVVVFDLLFRLLRYIYGSNHVTYVRNITDVDDKINARAGQDYPQLPLNEAIARVTEQTKRQFHADIAALSCLPPTVEPCATEHIDDMKAMIERLVAKSCAYVAEDHVLFHVATRPDYGALAHRSLDEMLAGARVEVAPYKRDPMDFVLWKPSKPGEPAWPSPCGIEAPGRPGWHIECSAMSWKHLGETFDIHGGGIDLMFPHHENELAQSRCALGVERMASVWMHNGFLQVEGRKMAKSEGNFVTIHDLLHTSALGGRSWPGDVLRLALLMTHYRDPLDFSADRLDEAAAKLDVWASLVSDVSVFDLDTAPSEDLVATLSDDLNTPQALTWLAAREDECRRSLTAARQFAADVAFMGCFPFDFGQRRYDGREDEPEQVMTESIAPRPLLEQELALLGMMTTKAVAATRRGLEVGDIEELVEARNQARAARNFADADRIRAELDAMGIMLRDSKDGTTWEVRR
jgi:cysteinyl-tRNA synthetase